MKLKVKLLIVQITSNDASDAVEAFVRTGRSLAAAVATGRTEVDFDETIGATRTRVRMKLEQAQSNTPTEG